MEDGAPRRPDRGSLMGRTLAARYLLEREVGEGGFGVVFQARDMRLGKVVAVKVLTSAVAENEESLVRFKQEATAAARIGHKSIVDVTDFDQDVDGTHFMVMEYLEGTDLSSVISSESPMPVARTLSIAARVGQALAAAHAVDIIHRDLKPANVFLTNVGPVSDFVKILDFGISKIMRYGDTSQTLTGAGQVVGTPRYMAPEQGLGNHVVDGRADVYALGTIMYEMLTGGAPYTGATHYEVIHNKASRDAIPPSVVYPPLEHSLEIDRLVMKALDRRPSERWPSMADFEGAMRELLEKVDPQEAAAVRPQAPLPRGKAGNHGGSTSRSMATRALGPTTSKKARPITPPIEQPRRLSWVAGAGLLAGAAVAGWLVFGRADAPPPEPTPLPESAAAMAPAPAPAPAPPEMVELRFHVTPREALVELGGVTVSGGKTEVPRSDTPLTLVVSFEGYQAETREIRPMTSGTITVTLKPNAPVARPKAPPKRGPRLPDSPL
jgi:serine/threonine protein kinase